MTVDTVVLTVCIPVALQKSTRHWPRLMQGILPPQKKLQPSLLHTTPDARLASAHCKRIIWNSTLNAKKPYTPP
jgi:hypothetical protein